MSGIEIRAKCSRCQTKFAASVQTDGFVLCPGCGSRLKYRKLSPGEGAGKPPDMTQELSAAVVATSMERGKQQAQSSSVVNGPPKPNPPVSAPSGAAPTASGRDGGKQTALSSQSSIEELMFALYQTQKQMLALLHERLRPAGPAGPADEDESDTIPDDDFAAFPPVATRSNKRKSVLLIDDDDASRDAAVAALEKAEVPVRHAVSGQVAMELLTEETPDVIALEGEMSGEISGRDIIDRVKAVMEWVNIPILLYTQARVESQQEARTKYGADGYILKGPKGPDALVSQVIALFRAG